jgi:hypothetical protein
VASQAEGADILEIALPATFGNRHDMVGIPKAPPHTRSDSPVPQQRLPIRTPRNAELARSGNRIHSAASADAAIAQQNVLAQIGRLGAQLPLMHAESGAKRESSARHLEGAPAAKASAVRSARNGSAINPPARHNAHCAHASFLMCFAAYQAFSKGRESNHEL